MDGRVARLTLAVDENGALFDGVLLKRNSYDLGVDLELRDAVQRLRFEHPEVACVVVESALPDVFCAGANIGMLARASHPLKVNFCKLTNETRLEIEDATRAGQRWIAALAGTASGGGYELALACERILLVDDRRAAVSLPELPLLAVLPGTGGLTRLVDKRARAPRPGRRVLHARRGRARAARARVETWSTRSQSRASSAALVEREIAAALAAGPRDARRAGVALEPLAPAVTDARARVSPPARWSSTPSAAPRRSPCAPSTRRRSRSGCGSRASSTTRCCACASTIPSSASGSLRSQGDPAHVRELDAALLRRRAGSRARCARCSAASLKRLENSARSCFALVDAGLVLRRRAASSSRSRRIASTCCAAASAAPALELGAAEPRRVPDGRTGCRGSRRASAATPGALDARARARRGPLDAERALALGLVTEAPDEIDWDDAVRVAIEERASFSPDALTGLEANLRFAGPETLETKIFARLSAWQNWIFQRPNAAGPDGALARLRPARAREVRLETNLNDERTDERRPAARIPNNVDLAGDAQAATRARSLAAGVPALVEGARARGSAARRDLPAHGGRASTATAGRTTTT